MKRSTERILTTHTGSLPRPDDFLPILEEKESGKLRDAAAFDEASASASGCKPRQERRDLSPKSIAYQENCQQSNDDADDKRKEDACHRDVGRSRAA